MSTTLRSAFALLFILLACLPLQHASAQSQGEKRIALVIGNADYQGAPLATAANDAGLVAQTLQAAGFDVSGARDLDRESLNQALREFLDKASASGPDTVAFVYLAGYGVQLEGQNYFVPVDASIPNPAAVQNAAVGLNEFTHALAQLRLKANIVAIDAARANEFARGGDQPLAGGLALIDPEANSLIAFNAAPGTVAPAEQGPYGAYAQALAEMMRTGGLPIDEVFARVRLRVSEKTSGAVLPWSASQLNAPFAFFERAANAPAPQVSYEQGRAMRTKRIADFNARDAYVAAVDRDTMQGYQDFLVAYPRDPMAKRVRAIVAARREAITWQETWRRNSPNAYWSYLRRYPRGPHAWDCRRRLRYLSADLEPPATFEVIDYDVPPPPEVEIVYVERPVVVFSDPYFDLPPPPPPPVIFLPPPPRDFVVLPPPPPVVDPYVLPSPRYVAMPEWVQPPRYVEPPPQNFIFNNIHNATVVNETLEAPRPRGEGGLTTGEVTAGAAGVAAGAAAAVILPHFLRDKAGRDRQPATMQQPGMVPLQPGAQPLQGEQQQPGRLLPGQVQPGRLLPGQVQPGQVQPGRLLPGQAQPGQAIQPEQLKPGQVAPGRLLPGQVQPGQTQPGLAQPEGQPGQLQPGKAGKLRPGKALPGMNGEALPSVEGGKPGQAGQPLPGAQPQGQPGQAEPSQLQTGKPGKLRPGKTLPGMNGETLPPVEGGKPGKPGQAGQPLPGAQPEGQPGQAEPGQLQTGKPGKLRPGKALPGMNGETLPSVEGGKPGKAGQPVPGAQPEGQPGQTEPGQLLPGQKGQKRLLPGGRQQPEGSSQPSGQAPADDGQLGKPLPGAGGPLQPLPGRKHPQRQPQDGAGQSPQPEGQALPDTGGQQPAGRKRRPPQDDGAGFGQPLPRAGQALPEGGEPMQPAGRKRPQRQPVPDAEQSAPQERPLGGRQRLQVQPGGGGGGEEAPAPRQRRPVPSPEMEPAQPRMNKVQPAPRAQPEFGGQAPRQQLRPPPGERAPAAGGRQRQCGGAGQPPCE